MMSPIERSSYDVVMTACDLLADLSVERENVILSQEGLLTDLSAGFQAFLAWVKRKVQELIHKFLIFIRDVKDVVVRLLYKKNSKFMQIVMSSSNGRIPFDDTTITIPYDVEEIHKYTSKLNDTVPFRITYDNTSLRQNIDKLHNIWNKISYPNSNINIVKSICCEYCRTIVNLLKNMESDALTMSEHLTKSRYLLDEAKTPQDLGQFLKQATGGMTRLATIDPMIVFGMSMQMFSTPETLKQLKQITISCVEALSMVIGFICNHIPALTTIISTIDTIYNHASFELHYVTRIDSGLKQHIDQMLKGLFTVDTITVTTKDPKTWPTIHNNTIVGWCYVNTGTTVVHDLWINGRYLLKDKSSSGVEESAKLLLSTIVHECVHLFDAKNSFEFEPREGNDTVQEQHAYTLEGQYRPTSSELNWAQTQIKTMISRMR